MEPIRSASWGLKGIDHNSRDAWNLDRIELSDEDHRTRLETAVSAIRGFWTRDQIPEELDRALIVAETRIEAASAAPEAP